MTGHDISVALLVASVLFLCVSAAILLSEWLERRFGVPFQAGVISVVLIWMLFLAWRLW